MRVTVCPTLVPSSRTQHPSLLIQCFKRAARAHWASPTSQALPFVLSAADVWTASPTSWMHSVPASRSIHPLDMGCGLAPRMIFSSRMPYHGTRPPNCRHGCSPVSYVCSPAACYVSADRLYTEHDRSRATVQGARTRPPWEKRLSANLPFGKTSCHHQDSSLLLVNKTRGAAWLQLLGEWASPNSSIGLDVSSEAWRYAAPRRHGGMEAWRHGGMVRWRHGAPAPPTSP